MNRQKNGLVLTSHRPTANSYNVNKGDMLSRLCWTCFVIEWYKASCPRCLLPRVLTQEQ